MHKKGRILHKAPLITLFYSPGLYCACLFVSNKRQNGWTDGPKFFVAHRVFPGKGYKWSKFKSFVLFMIFIFQHFEDPQIFLMKSVYYIYYIYYTQIENVYNFNKRSARSALKASFFIQFMYIYSYFNVSISYFNTWIKNAKIWITHYIISFSIIFKRIVKSL